MLKDEKNDLLHLLSILESTEKILKFSSNVGSAEDFYRLNDQLNYNAVLNLLAHIGETVNKISDNFLRQTEQVQWSKMRALRNRVVHDYLGLDVVVIYETVRQDIPALKNVLYEEINVRLGNGTFDPEELRAAQTGMYYQNIDFSRFL